MNLVRELEEYLALRRAFGAKLRGPDVSLRHFVTFMQDSLSPFVSTDIAVKWATQPSNASGVHHAARYRWVRGFSGFLHSKDPRHEIPPVQLLNERPKRISPYLYSDDEVVALMGEACALPSAVGLRTSTCATIIGLLSASGMRLSEALGLELEDVDLSGRVLTIRRTKFGKSRIVPVHPTTGEALEVYAKHRDKVFRIPRSCAFFVSEKGLRVRCDAVQRTFRALCDRLGFRALSNGRKPRLHDLRHRFAVRTLIEWYRQGLDASRRLPVLSTYLGHARVADTYWYLQAVPELLELAVRRLDRPSVEKP